MKHINVLIHFTGYDYPGILADLLDLMADLNIDVIDVQQTTSLGQLSLSLLTKVPEGHGLESMRQIINSAKGHKLNVDFFPLEEGELVRDEQMRTYALTVLSKQLHTSDFAAVARCVAKFNINIIRMNRLSQGSLQCIELWLGFAPEHVQQLIQIKRALFEVAFNHHFDLAIQPEDLFRRSKRLIVMDMDSTLIQQEVIDEIADFAGVKKQVAEITERAMRGELEFDAALSQRVALLKGLDVSSLEGVLSRIHLTTGAEKLIFILKKLGFKIAVISGGFSYFTKYFQDKLGLDYNFANELEVVNGKLTGKVLGEVVNRQRKASLLRELAEKEKIPLDQTIAVGDGANDLDMLEAAGFGIAFNAKPKVKEQAKAFISVPSLETVLYLLGVSEQEIQEMCNEVFDGGSPKKTS